MKLENIFTNKYILYLTVFVALTNIVGYLMIRDYNSLIFFFAIAILSSYFSKNMTVNLIVAILATNIIFANAKLLEGFSGKKAPRRRKKESHLGHIVYDTSDNDASGAKQGSCKQKVAGTGSCDGLDITTCTNSKNSGVCQWTEGMSTKGVPASTPAVIKSSKEDDDESEGDRIDYASTMQAAYNNLQQMLGQDGIKNLSQDTQSLVQQQKELMRTFEGLQPLVKQAGGMMETLKNMPSFEKLTAMGGKIK